MTLRHRLRNIERFVPAYPQPWYAHVWPTTPEGYAVCGSPDGVRLISLAEIAQRWPNLCIRHYHGVQPLRREGE